MTTARTIIQDSLTFGLNKLSPGETLQPELAARCIDALNNIVDEMNGIKSMMFAEVLTSAAVSGTVGTLGGTWASLAPGTQILGASVQYTSGTDMPVSVITLPQYHAIPVKSTTSIPQVLAPDGGANVYMWPGATGQTVTLRTPQAFADFADQDTNYVMPAGYRAALTDLLSEKMAPTLIGGVTTEIAVRARAAKLRLAARNASPAIIDAARRVAGNIYTGWN